MTVLNVIALLVFFAACASASAHESSEVEIQFANFQKRFGKVYADEAALVSAKKCFAINLAALANKSPKSHGVTKFFDVCPEDFKNKYLMKKRLQTLGTHPGAQTLVVPEPAQIKASDIPPFDWRDKGVVAQVKDQGQCGSCWAFSATVAAEAGNAFQSGRLVALSDEETLQCTWSGSCDGGEPLTALYWIEKNRLDTSTDYPYESGDGDTGVCNLTAVANGRYGFSGGVLILPGGNEPAILNWTHTGGPVSVCLSADSWDSYTGGVMTDCPDDIISDHCVAIVGYGNDPKLHDKPYWIVRNSWGLDWGIDGYIYLEYGTHQCGIANLGAFAALPNKTKTDE